MLRMYKENVLADKFWSKYEAGRAQRAAAKWEASNFKSSQQRWAEWEQLHNTAQRQRRQARDEARSQRRALERHSMRMSWLVSQVAREAQKGVPVRYPYDLIATEHEPSAVTNSTAARCSANTGQDL
eukprot:NODE_4045_length_703_cov_67.229358_g3420_i0.p3 GENE.NODE_4045_length_703_cov_67.229358_g3420_i0~~NODE_4045_length_703_cov_67.229358_g3420_i0.p3  ORF type:complete len:127 (+),score=21.69 NODE_4045_length_703_cov_67.229358_g3420_i0:131-511(+)